MSHWQMDLSIKLIQQEFGRQLQLDAEKAKKIQLFFYLEGDELKICPEYNHHVFKGQSMTIAKLDLVLRKIKIIENIFSKGFAKELVLFLNTNIGKAIMTDLIKIEIASLTRDFCKSNLIAISSKSSF
jgi:hypothetical protein